MASIKKYFIKDFSRGVISDNDSINMPENSAKEIQNLEIFPGGLRCRKATKSLSTFSVTRVNGVFECKVLDADVASKRVLLLKDAATFKAYSESSEAYTALTKTLDAYSGTVANSDQPFFAAINNVMRAGLWAGWNDTAALAFWMGDIDRGFFNDNETLDGWMTEDAVLKPPLSTDLTISSTNDGTYPNAIDTGFFTIRATYTYDGFQESWFEDNNGSAEVTNDPGVKTRLDCIYAIDFSSLNKRVTAINFYCQYQDDEDDPTTKTGFWYIGSIGINDAKWYDDTGVSGDYQIGIRLSKTATGDKFPFHYKSEIGHASTSFADELQVIEEEMYTKLNAITSVKGFDLNGYSKSLWVNQRNFAIRPNLDYTLEELPYDIRQVVLFSQLAQPDCFHVNIDYIDCQTTEGDACTGLATLFGDLIVFKELNMFRINFNNSGNSLDWRITEHFQSVGCVAPNSIASGNGRIFFAGIDNIYMFDGRIARPITKDRIRDDYVSKLAARLVSDGNYDKIYGLFDPLRNNYRLMFSTSGSCYVYDIDRGSWRIDDYDDTERPEFLALSADNEILGTKSDGTTGLVMKVDDSVSANHETFDISYISQWLSIDGNPFGEKRLCYIKVLMRTEADEDITVRIYKDFIDEGVVTPATHDNTASLLATGADYKYFYFENSSIFKVLKFDIYSGNIPSDEQANLQILEIEIGYETLDELGK